MGYLLLAGGKPRLVGQSGFYPNIAFPLPLVLETDLTMLYATCRQHALDDECQPLVHDTFDEDFRRWVNLTLAVQSLNYGDGESRAVSRSPPTKAQLELWSVIARALDTFCEDIGDWPSLADSRHTLRHDKPGCYAPSRTPSPALGLPRFTLQRWLKRRIRQ